VQLDLFERYGLTRRFMARYRLRRNENALTAGLIQSEIAHAQRVIEGQNFDIRRSLYRFSALVDLQRQIVQILREQVLLGAAENEPRAESSECDSRISTGMTPEHTDDKTEWPARLAQRAPDLFREGLRRLGPTLMAELERRATLFHLDRLWSDHLSWIQDTRDSIHLVHLGGREPIDEFRKWATDEFLSFRNRLAEAVLGEMTAIIRRDGPADADLERLKGPNWELDVLFSWIHDTCGAGNRT
jgi:preprotein translocase subunit SecA